MMELPRVVFISIVFLCGVRDAHADTNLTDLTGQVRVLSATIQAWKGRVVNIKTDMKQHFKRWESSLKNQLTDTFVPALIKPLVEQANRLRVSVHYTKTQLRTVTQQFRRVERERDSYKESIFKLRSEVNTDIHSLQLQLNETKAGLRDANMVNSVLQEDLITLNTSCVKREEIEARSNDEQSYRKGLQEMQQKLKTDIQSLNIQQNQTIDDLHDSNQVITGLTEDMVTLNTSCVKREEIEAHTHDEQSYRKGLQEMQQKLKTDIQSLNIQQNQTIDDLHDSNQVITGLTEDMVTLNTSCVKREEIEAHTHDEQSYRKGLQEMQQKLKTDIQSLNIQQNQTIDDLHDSNQVITGLTEDMVTLNTSCVKREEIEAHTHDEQSYRKGLQEMQQKLKTDIQSLNIQQNQTIDDLHDSNQVITGLTEDMVTLNTSCVKREEIEAHTHDEQSYRKGLQEMQQKLKTDIQSLNIQQNQTIDDLHDSNQVITGLTEDMVTLNTSCVKREEIEAHTHDEQSYRKGLQEMQQKLKTDIQSLNIQQNQTIDDLHDSNQVITGLTEDMVTLNTSCVKREEIEAHTHDEQSYRKGASSDSSQGERAAQMTTVTTHASSDPSRTTRTPVTTTKKPATQATPSPADCEDLYDASEAGNLEEVKRILSQGVDVNCRWGGWSETPVMEAAYRGHRDVVELLVSEGADVSLVDRDGYNTLHYASYGGHLETVKFVLSLHVVDIDARDNYGQTAADLARSGGHTRVLDLLVSRGAQ
ncbi:cytadherence high molecular weight protein 2-like isoform X1 [Haliotis rufescens]|uniref:cytadherence high molecular weight protein 2-like isoform X1 n=1 Tax=Haliotis rufescens TaxID=6454 RepID=UPI00201F9CAF|nr:cytadherence high molecular weight protein 2-like isoform X1 [Haliotis rufescens]